MLHSLNDSTSCCDCCSPSTALHDVVQARCCCIAAPRCCMLGRRMLWLAAHGCSTRSSRGGTAAAGRVQVAGASHRGARPRPATTSLQDALGASGPASDICAAMLPRTLEVEEQGCQKVWMQARRRKCGKAAHQAYFLEPSPACPAGAWRRHSVLMRALSIALRWLRNQVLSWTSTLLADHSGAIAPKPVV